MTLDKIVNPGTGRHGPVFCRIQYDGMKLSITGVVGPRRNGDATGGCGQIGDHLADDVQAFTIGWDAELLAKFARTWDHWHLNDLRPGCVHQRAGGWDLSGELEVVSYKLTTDAYHARVRAIDRAALASARGEAATFTETERALVLLPEWFRPRYSPPDADSPLSGCYEVEKRETKRAGWVYPAEHPSGFLMKPCEVCGYKYGSAWLTETVPDAVLTFLESLPTTTVTPAWV